MERSSFKAEYELGLLFISVKGQELYVDPNCIKAITNPPAPPNALGGAGGFVHGAALVMFQGGAVVLNHITVLELGAVVRWARKCDRDDDGKDKTFTVYPHLTPDK